MSRPELEWLIVGGGIHGVHIAARLMAEKKVSRASLRLLDPAETLLARWRRNTQTTGMTHLRSPAVHNLAMHPHSLRWFTAGRRGPCLIPPLYERPSLAEFDAHSRAVIKRYGLSELHLRGWASSMEPGETWVTTHTECGRVFTSERVVLALGPASRVDWPSWAPRNHARIDHVFAGGFEWSDWSGRRVLVVGGGITAAQVALRLASEGARPLLLSRHKRREHEFDSHHRWLHPRRMQSFTQERSYARRRWLIQRARYRGSMPSELSKQLGRAIRERTIDWRLGEITQLVDFGQFLQLSLASGEDIEADQVLLATGHSKARPGGELVSRLADSERLPCADCGFPILDPYLRWHPRIHVSGALAELELGPTAPNISGARRAAERVVASMSAQTTGRIQSTVGLE